MDVEPFDRRRPIGKAQRRAEPRPRRSAVGDPAPGKLVAIGRIGGLIISVVEFALVHIEPDDRPFDLRGGGHRVHCTLCPFIMSLRHVPTSLSPNTGCSSANPATAKSPIGLKPPRQCLANSCNARMVR